MILSIFLLYLVSIRPDVSLQACLGSIRKIHLANDAKFEAVHKPAPLLYAISAEEPRKPVVFTGDQSSTTSSTVSTYQPTQANTIDSTQIATKASNDSRATTEANQSHSDPTGTAGEAISSTSSPPKVTSKPHEGEGGHQDPAKKPTHENNKPAEKKTISDLGIILYSAFIVYISLAKLIYHNVPVVKKRLTESGFLIVFGIIWELVLRQFVQSSDVLPRFNSRIFFYLFLPSTILDSASMLANKWLFLNMLTILILSIFGTLIYAASIGFTIYFLNLDSNFAISTDHSESTETLMGMKGETLLPIRDISSKLSQSRDDKSPARLVGVENDLNLIDCLVFGTVLSSVDSTSMLNVLRLNQVNEKLYYLVLGESLMNNAVVLVMFNLLLDFLNVTRLTVVKIYFAIMQFFFSLIGAILIGLSLAVVALISIRLIKRFQKTDQLTSYQNQGQAMVEVLLILKLAYFSYTIASLAGTPSILGLATFGVLQDQYIKVNLSIRSQFTLRQVIFATKTMGHSLVYPLIGMLLVEVAYTSQFFYQAWLSLDPNNWLSGVKYANHHPHQAARNRAEFHGSVALSSNTYHPMKDYRMADTNGLYWNFKLLSLVTLVTLSYRFIVVLVLSQLSNILSGRQLRIRLKEQVLLAFGSLKGPLALALVHRLIEHDEYRERAVRNKHLFIYTILFITFMSNIVKGSFIGPLVGRMHLNQCHSPGSLSASNSFILFTEVSCMVTEYATHGLNCILGRNKSPYDRFVEFNGTHIRPWLADKKTDTDWLSVFYDNLILEETMDANFFNRSVQETAKVFASKGLSHRLSLESQAASDRSALRNWRRSLMKPENAVGPGDQELRLVNIDDKRRDRSESALLRELVLFNLKSEESNRRKANGNRLVHRLSRDNETMNVPSIPNIQRMLSDSSSAVEPHLGRSRPIHRAQNKRYQANKPRQLRTSETRILQETSELEVAPRKNKQLTLRRKIRVKK